MTIGGHDIADSRISVRKIFLPLDGTLAEFVRHTKDEKNLSTVE